MIKEAIILFLLQMLASMCGILLAASLADAVRKSRNRKVKKRRV